MTLATQQIRLGAWWRWGKRTSWHVLHAIAPDEDAPLCGMKVPELDDLSRYSETLTPLAVLLGGSLDTLCPDCGRALAAQISSTKETT